MIKRIKRLSFILIILFASFINAQEINPKNQTFKVSDFEFATQNADWSLDVNYNLKMSQHYKDAYKYPYSIHYRLFKGDEKVWENQSIEHVYAREDDAEDMYADLTFFKIPYDEINLDSGTHSLVLKISASYKEHQFPVFYSKELNITIPKIYAYDEQEFEISNYRIAIDSTVFDTPGILIRFKSKAKFIQNHIKGVKDDPFIGKYLFTVRLANQSNGESINFYNSKTGSYSFNVTKLVENHQIFIPFNELQLKAKEQKVSINLQAYTKDKTKQISQLLNKEIAFKQPVLHAFSFNLIKALVKDNNYDPSNVFGRVFSSIKSNIGKGNPDVYWELRTGKFVKFSSEIMDNSFDAKAQKTMIWVTNQDQLQLVFWDEDVFNDDWIETIKLENLPIGTSKKKILTQTKNLETLSFEYVKM